jgi:hypothetical protein
MIVALIKEIAEGLPVSESPNVYPTFIHGEKEILNSLADEVTNVIVALDEPIIYNLIASTGGYKEKEYPIIMTFLAKTDFDPDQPANHRPCIEQMTALSDRFLNRLESNSSVRSIKSISGTEVKNILDANFSGVILRMTVVPFSDNTSCP